MVSVYHSAEVSRRCGICSRKLASVKMPVEKFEDDLLVVFELDIRHDVADSGGTFMHFSLFFVLHALCAVIWFYMQAFSLDSQVRSTH